MEKKGYFKKLISKSENDPEVFYTLKLVEAIKRNDDELADYYKNKLDELKNGKTK